MEKFDLIVIGGGPGGYPAAIRAAQLGTRTAIIEKELLGGTCLNRGCIPTKTLISGAEIFGHIQQAGQLGIKVDGAAVDYPAMVKRKDGVVEKLRGGIKQLLAANGVAVFEGTASFINRNRLEVRGKDSKTRLEADKIIIATGSAPVIPGFLPKSSRVVDSRLFLELTELPETMIVLGGGYIGCELACMAARLGAKVTLVELLEDILTSLDNDLQRKVKKHMEKELGMTILTGHALEDVKADKKSVCGKVADKTVEAELLLAAVGRRPVTEDLHLENAGLNTNEKGFIEVDEYNRTTAANIYAVGDVNGGPQLAHAATSQGIIAAENACTKTSRKNETLVPGVIFTFPEVAVAGLTEAEAKAQGLKVRIDRYPYQALGRALAAHETTGFVKWIADEETDQLLGAAVVGAHATDLIAEAAVAIRNELTAEELGHTIHPHPTFGEIWMEAAHAVSGTAIHAAPKKRG